MRLKELIHPVDGIFTNMPQDIWGSELDPTFLDVELFTRIGDLDASPLVEFYVEDGFLDTVNLSTLLYQRYYTNWSRIWSALQAEYDIMLTSTMDEERKIERETTGLETRDLIDVQSGTVDTASDSHDASTRSGSIDRTAENELTRNLTDLETRALSGQNTEGGTEKLTDTFADSTSRNDVLTKSGTERDTLSGTLSGSGSDVTTFSGSEKHTTSNTESSENDKKNTGTVGTKITGTQKGTGSVENARKVYGVGAAAAAPESTDTATETRNFNDTNDTTRTDNTTEKDTGSRTTSGTDDKTFTGRKDAKVTSIDNTESSTNTKTFTGRTDVTTGTDTHTGTIKHDTTFGRTNSTTDTGTLTNEKSGTEGTTENSSETYNDLLDVRTNDENSITTRDLTETKGGTVDNVGTETVTETFKSEGSSPLRTFQALIQEEVEGRSGQGWNFTDLVIRDVQTMIASKIWRRTHVAL